MMKMHRASMGLLLVKSCSSYWESSCCCDGMWFQDGENVHCWSCLY